jgi:hypothetical protein
VPAARAHCNAKLGVENIEKQQVVLGLKDASENMETPTQVLKINGQL